MRRENGTGTIYKVKDRKLRKPYKVIVVTGYNIENGNPIRKVLGYYSKASEANDALANYTKNKDTYDLKRLTVKDIFERWWAIHESKIKPNTIEHYQVSYNRYISKIKDRIFSELKTIDLQDFFDKEIRTWSSQYHAKVVLRGMYKYALKYEIVDKDYSALIEIIKRERVITRKIFTEEEREILFNSENRICKALCVLTYTGLRIEEFLSLRREDIENGFIFLKQSKTSAGIRAIPIHNKILNIVNSFLNENMDFLFTWKNENKKMNYDTFRINFIKIMKKLGMEHTIHDTRHTFASMLNQVGANDVVISNLAGHEDKEFTKRVYTHTELEDLKNAVDLLQWNRYFENKKCGVNCGVHS